MCFRCVAICKPKASISPGICRTIDFKQKHTLGHIVSLFIDQKGYFPKVQRFPIYAKWFCIPLRAVLGERETILDGGMQILCYFDFRKKRNGSICCDLARIASRDNYEMSNNRKRSTYQRVIGYALNFRN
ncbi:hypothetical protein AVEN_103111-1 [Araneus ventricosus]|uniref:Uncharacterized protein n=1 Tax=Araneus ventricosus TaxID=182803 RepID=A0A4Y2HVD1_ARAVE|nr:hypothetical protein AVEN_103111-1 [Araneus ventricosus]